MDQSYAIMTIMVVIALVLLLMICGYLSWIRRLLGQIRDELQYDNQPRREQEFRERHPH